ncbi:MAG: Holliday junction resolvase RuvX [Simkaniaceae bacterium]
MGRLIGIDFGLKRIGLARTDEGKRLASPFKRIIAGKTVEETCGILFKEIGSLKEIDAFIVGLPLMMSGRDSEITIKARAFAKTLEEMSEKPVHLWDERLTSKLVENEMRNAGVKRKKRAQEVDVLAAVVILQSYLESCYNRGIL